MVCQLHFNKLFKIKEKLQLAQWLRVTVQHISKLFRKSGMYLSFPPEMGDNMLKWTFFKNMVSKSYN